MNVQEIKEKYQADSKGSFGNVKPELRRQMRVNAKNLEIEKSMNENFGKGKQVKSKLDEVFSAIGALQGACFFDKNLTAAARKVKLAADTFSKYFDMKQNQDRESRLRDRKLNNGY